MTDFPTFWDIARHMRGRCPNPRSQALKAWDKAVKGGADPREIIAGLKGFESYNNENDVEAQFVCQASKFLNQAYWEQYLGEPSAKAYLAAPELRVVK